MKQLPMGNNLFYAKFHSFVNELEEVFDREDINIGTSDPAGMSNHEIATIAAWECFHKTPEIAKMIDLVKKEMHEIDKRYAPNVFHLLK